MFAHMFDSKVSSFVPIVCQKLTTRRERPSMKRESKDRIGFVASKSAPANVNILPDDIPSGVLDENNIAGGGGETITQGSTFALIETVVNDAIGDTIRPRISEPCGFPSFDPSSTRMISVSGGNGAFRTARTVWAMVSR